MADQPGSISTPVLADQPGIITTPFTQDQPATIMPVIGPDQPDFSLTIDIDIEKLDTTLAEEQSTRAWQNTLFLANAIIMLVLACNALLFLCDTEEVREMVMCRLLFYGIQSFTNQLMAFLMPRPPSTWTTISRQGFQDLVALLTTISIVLIIWTLALYDPNNIRSYGLLADWLVLIEKHGQWLYRLCRLFYGCTQPGKVFWSVLVLFVAWFVDSKPWHRFQPSLDGAVWGTLWVRSILELVTASLGFWMSSRV